jgi:hypothetical protein
MNDYVMFAFMMILLYDDGGCEDDGDGDGDGDGVL